MESLVDFAPPDYLVCGNCSKQFPLASMPAFIQHKKLDCNDSFSTIALNSKSLQCTSCPQEFETPWSLLQHAQSDHHLPIYQASSPTSTFDSQITSPLSNTPLHPNTPLQPSTPLQPITPLQAAPPLQTEAALQPLTPAQPATPLQQAQNSDVGLATTEATTTILPSSSNQAHQHAHHCNQLSHQLAHQASHHQHHHHRHQHLLSEQTITDACYQQVHQQVHQHHHTPTITDQNECKQYHQHHGQSDNTPASNDQHQTCNLSQILSEVYIKANNACMPDCSSGQPSTTASPEHDNDNSGVKPASTWGPCGMQQTDPCTAEHNHCTNPAPHQWHCNAPTPPCTPALHTTAQPPQQTSKQAIQITSTANVLTNDSGTTSKTVMSQTHAAGTVNTHTTGATHAHPPNTIHTYATGATQTHTTGATHAHIAGATHAHPGGTGHTHTPGTIHAQHTHPPHNHCSSTYSTHSAHSHHHNCPPPSSNTISNVPSHHHCNTNSTTQACNNADPGCLSQSQMISQIVATLIHDTEHLQCNNVGQDFLCSLTDKLDEDRKTPGLLNSSQACHMVYGSKGGKGHAGHSHGAKGSKLHSVIQGHGGKSGKCHSGKSASSASSSCPDSTQAYCHIAANRRVSKGKQWPVGCIAQNPSSSKPDECLACIDNEYYDFENTKDIVLNPKIENKCCAQSCQSICKNPGNSATVQHQQAEHELNSNAGADGGGKEDDCNRCNNSGCGITVMPGTHEELQSCCVSIVPKKRQNHFKTKHARKKGKSHLPHRLHAISDDLPLAESTPDEEDDYDDEDTTEVTTEVVVLEPEAVPHAPDTTEVSTTEDLQLSDTPGLHWDAGDSNTSPTQMRENQNATKQIFGIPINNDNLEDRLSKAESMSTSSSVPSANKFTSSSSTRVHKQPSRMTECKQLGRKRRYPTSKPFKCDQCAMSFNQRIHLRKHQQSKHTGIKPFKCQHCDYSTVEKSHLKVHVRIHTGEKPFKCQYCDYATAQNSTLKIHIKRHHMDKQVSSSTISAPAPSPSSTMTPQPAPQPVLHQYSTLSGPLPGISIKEEAIESTAPGDGEPPTRTTLGKLIHNEMVRAPNPVITYQESSGCPSRRYESSASSASTSATAVSSTVDAGNILNLSNKE